MFETLKAYATIIKDGLFALALVAVMAGMWHLGAEHVRGQWTAADLARVKLEQTAAAAALRAQQDHDDALNAQHAAEKDKLKKGYADEIDSLRRNAADSGGMRRNDRVCAPRVAATRPAETSSASRGNDDVAGTGALSQHDARDSSELMPPEYQQKIDALQDQADLVVASCRLAQKFIIDNGFAP
jgi:hypothetical protein